MPKPHTFLELGKKNLFIPTLTHWVLCRFWNLKRVAQAAKLWLLFNSSSIVSIAKCNMIKTFSRGKLLAATAPRITTPSYTRCSSSWGSYLRLSLLKTRPQPTPSLVDPVTLLALPCAFNGTGFRPESFLTLNVAAPFSPLSSACWLAVSTVPCRARPLICKNVHAVDTYRTSWQILLLYSCPNFVFIRFPCGPAAATKWRCPSNFNFVDISWPSCESSKSNWQWDDVQQWDSRWASSLFGMPTNWGSNASCKDWTLMLQSYLILSLEWLPQDWIQSLSNQYIHSPLLVQNFGFRIQS